MARIRSIKPEFFVSEQIADVSPTCRLLFIGMWLFCDDAGIHPASSRQLKMEVFPGDDITTADVSEMVGELLRVGLLVEYEAVDETETKSYWQVTGWHHQKIERPRYQYPQPNSPTPRRHVDDTSPTPRSPRVRAGSDRTGPETIGEKERADARFVAPNVEEVQKYAAEAKLNIDAERFVDFYASKDWKVGKAKMKNWQAAARNANRDGWCTVGGNGKPAGPSYDEYEKERRRRFEKTKALLEKCHDGQE